MRIPKEQKNIPLKCWYNGRRAILPLEKAYRLFFSVSFAWILFLDLYRTDGRGRRPKGGALVKDAPGAAKFTLKLLTRGRLALSVSDSCLMDEHGDSPSRGLLTAWAHRFGGLFDGPKPFEQRYVYDEHGNRQLAYLMKPDERWLIIVDVDSDSGFTREDVDWQIFETGPQDV